MALAVRDSSTINPTRDRILKWTLRIFSFVVFLSVWQWYGTRPDMFAVAPPTEVFPALVEGFLSGELSTAALGTVQSMLVGFLLAAAVGVPVGFAIAISAPIRNVVEPLVNAAYASPMALLIPIMGAYIGLGFRGRLLLVFVWAVFVIIINTAAGVREVSPSLIEMAQSFCLSRWSIYPKVILPAALPLVLVGLRLGAGRALRGAVTAEILLSVTNLGEYLIHAGSTFQMPNLLAGIVAVVILGLVIIQGAEYLERRVLLWRHM